MRHMMVLKDELPNAKIGGGVIVDSSEIDLLVDGAIAIFGEDGVALTAANIAGVDPNNKLDGVHSVTFAVGGQLENDRWVRTFLRTEDNFYKFKAYVAPLPQIQFIGDNGGGGSTNMPIPVSGDTAFIRLTLTTPIRDLTFDKYRFEYQVKSGDDEAAVLNGLIASINLDLSLDVTASAVVNVVTTGIQLAADIVGEVWSVGLDGLLKDSDTLSDGSGTSQLANIGNGSNAEIREMYESFTPNFGKNNKTWLSELFFSQNDNILAAQTYEVWNMYWSNKRLRRDGMQSVGGQELIIAAPEAWSGANGVDFVTILDKIFQRTSYGTVSNLFPPN